MIENFNLDTQVFVFLYIFISKIKIFQQRNIASNPSQHDKIRKVHKKFSPFKKNHV